jgi:hypothetical protein
MIRRNSRSAAEEIVNSPTVVGSGIASIVIVSRLAPFGKLKFLNATTA